MCILIRSAEVGIELVYWSSEDVCIYVRSDAPPDLAHDEIRAILADLDAPPSGNEQLICFCGDTIPQPPGLITAHRTTTTHRQELRYGA